jgi:hypothetical protein
MMRSIKANAPLSANILLRKSSQPFHQKNGTGLLCMAVRQDTERVVNGAVVREKAMSAKAGLKPKSKNLAFKAHLVLGNAQSICRILASPIQMSKLGICPTPPLHSYSPSTRESSQNSRTVTLRAPFAVPEVQMRRRPFLLSVNAGWKFYSIADSLVNIEESMAVNGCWKKLGVP